MKMQKGAFFNIMVPAVEIAATVSEEACAVQQLFTPPANYRKGINDQGDGVVCIPNDTMGLPLLAQNDCIVYRRR